jgi:hypothetical protein
MPRINPRSVGARVCSLSARQQAATLFCQPGRRDDFPRAERNLWKLKLLLPEIPKVRSLKLEESGADLLAVIL